MKKVREKYEKTKHSKVKCFLHILREAEIHTISKTQNIGIVNLLTTGKLWENTNIPKVWVSCVFRTTPFWRDMETYGKTQTFQSYGFLTYFMCAINRTIPKI